MLVKRLRDGRELIALADGMGGHVAGEVASQRALEVLAAALDAGAGLREAVKAANVAVHGEATGNVELNGMGTTLVAAVVAGTEYEVANVGDSRAYRLEAAGIEQLTTDHSFMAEAVESGELSRDEVARSPWRNALTRAVGTDPDVEVDVLGPYSAEVPHVLVLCSDGLYRAVPDDALLGEVFSATDAETLVRALTVRALNNGSDDNISVAIVAFGVEAEALAGTGGARAARAGGPTRADALPTAPVSTAQAAEAPGRNRNGGDGRRRRRKRTRSRGKPRSGLMKYEILLIAILLLVAVGFAFLLTAL